MRSLPPDWAGRAVTSLVSSAPMGALYNAGGRMLFGCAADEPVDEVTIRYGVSEEHKTFAVELHAAAATEERRLELVLDATTGSLAEVVQRWRPGCRDGSSSRRSRCRRWRSSPSIRPGTPSPGRERRGDRVRGGPRGSDGLRHRLDRRRLAHLAVGRGYQGCGGTGCPTPTNSPIC
jgi:hypothetical protein